MSVYVPKIDLCVIIISNLQQVVFFTQTGMSVVRCIVDIPVCAVNIYSQFLD